MKWEFVVVCLGLYALIAYLMKLRSENKKMKLQLQDKKETK